MKRVQPTITGFLAFGVLLASSAAAHAAPVLSGSTVFSTDGSGNGTTTPPANAWNTVGGDSLFNLYFTTTGTFPGITDRCAMKVTPI
jgi:hypothetical protein